LGGKAWTEKVGEGSEHVMYGTNTEVFTHHIMVLKCRSPSSATQWVAEQVG
jgi:hypothetical protein